MKTLIAILVTAKLLFSLPDLIAPASVRLLSTSHWLWDTIEVTTYLENIGTDTAWSPLYPSSYPAVDIRIDSLYKVNEHNIYGLIPNYFISFKDTFTVMKGPFSLTTWSNPLGYFGEGGAERLNNVLSWPYNFHPTIVYDTIYTIIIDTVHDTIRDTLWTGSLNKPLAKISPRVVDSKIYNILGQVVWSGKCMEGAIPRVHIGNGMHVLVQGEKKKYLKFVNLR